MTRHPPRSTLFPSTPLFRSARAPTVSRREPAEAPPRRRRRRGHAASAPQSRPRSRPQPPPQFPPHERSEEHTSELQSRQYLVCRLLLEKKKRTQNCNPVKRK